MISFVSNIYGSVIGLLFMQLIPRKVHPEGHEWKAGVEVKVVTKKGMWKVGIVISNEVE